MAENEDSGSKEQGGSAQSLIAQVKAELTKSKKEALKGKLKNLLQKREEAEKALKVIDKEISDEVEKFESGL